MDIPVALVDGEEAIDLNAWIKMSLLADFPHPTLVFAANFIVYLPLFSASM